MPFAIQAPRSSCLTVLHPQAGLGVYKRWEKRLKWENREGWCLEMGLILVNIAPSFVGSGQYKSVGTRASKVLE